MISRPAATLCAIAAATSFLGCAKNAREQASFGRYHPWTVPGVLRIGSAAEPRTLNTMLDQDSASLNIGMFVYSWAVRYDRKARPIPDALREVPTIANGDVSKDGLTLKYKLRSNILWQDGKPLTCGDLRFTWRAVMNPHNNTVVTDGYRDIRSIECSDPHVAIIRMNRVYAPFLQELFGVNGNAPILPEHLLERYNDNKGSLNTAPYNDMPIGSGPFKVVAWDRGREIRMVANRKFYLGAPKLAEVDYRYLPDPNTAELQLIKHEVDIAGIMPQAVRRFVDLAADPRAGLTIASVDRFAWSHVDFNLKNPILSDRNVRLALAYATDRNDIITKVLRGRAVPAETDQQPELSWARTDGVEHHFYNPNKAREILDADGWRTSPDGIRVKNGRRLEFLFTAAGTAATLAGGDGAVEVLLQREWRNVGAQADIKNFQSSVLLDPSAAGILERGRYDVAFLNSFSAADPDDSSWYSADNRAPRGQNWMQWDNPIATAAIRDALRTVDQARRRRDYVIVQQQLTHDVPTIILYFNRTTIAYNSDLKGFDPSSVASVFWDPWNYSI